MYGLLPDRTMNDEAVIHLTCHCSGITCTYLYIQQTLKIYRKFEKQIASKYCLLLSSGGKVKGTHSVLLVFLY